MTSKKILVIPGYVRSIYDGDIHWVGVDSLLHLYGVRPSDSIRVYRKELPFELQWSPDWEVLKPLESGNYRNIHE